MPKNSHADLHNLGKRFMWRCHYCHRLAHCRVCEPSRPGQLSATRDHYVPRCRGGRSRGPNIVLACFECNQRKADTPPEDKRDWRHSRHGSGSSVQWQFDTGR